MPESLVKTLDNQPLNVIKSFAPKLKIIGVALLVIMVLSGAAVYFLGVVPGRRLYASVLTVKATAQSLPVYIKDQDLAGTRNQLDMVSSDLEAVRADLGRFAWTRAVPVLRNYYSDGEHGLNAADEMIRAAQITIDALAPYADVIGLKGLGTTGDGAKTAQDRITFILNTLDKIKPQLSQIGGHVEAAKKEMDYIDPNRYPEEFRGIRVREQLASGKLMLDQSSSLINDAQPLLEAAPYILGLDAPRRYLLLFQNDAELRPTGGFMTGYAVIEVNKGKINTVLSDDIYKLDEKFPKRIPAPEPIKKYHPNVPYWYLRDQNLSPDFKVSMDTFFPNYQLTNSPKVDGVIAVTSQVLVNLLKVTGPIGVPGFGNFSAENDKRCDCPNVFYQLQVLAGDAEAVVWDSVTGKIVKAPANYGDRKRFLGPVMYSVLANTMAQPKSKFPELFKAVISSIENKSAQLYFTDPRIQSAVESFNLAGRVNNPDTDYLLVVDTNFSGGKTNIWVKYDAEMDVQISSDGTVTKTLTLKYSNPNSSVVEIESGRRLNGLYRDWLRVYVPLGSKLIEASGFETGQATGEDLGKTVFEGFFTLTPGNLRTITLKYELPGKVRSPYALMVQKQPGAKDFIYKIKVNGKSQPELILNADKELSIFY